MMSEIDVQWSEKTPRIEVTNTDELDHILDHMEANVSSEHPMIVFVNAHGYRVSLGLGYMESFMHFEQETGDPPYIIRWVTVVLKGWWHSISSEPTIPRSLGIT
jgi:hypothetical protein